jgi:hypothetical protein
MALINSLKNENEREISGGVEEKAVPKLKIIS